MLKLPINYPENMNEMSEFLHCTFKHKRRHIHKRNPPPSHLLRLQLYLGWGSGTKEGSPGGSCAAAQHTPERSFWGPLCYSRKRSSDTRAHLKMYLSLFSGQSPTPRANAVPDTASEHRPPTLCGLCSREPFVQLTECARTHQSTTPQAYASPADTSDVSDHRAIHF